MKTKTNNSLTFKEIIGVTSAMLGLMLMSCEPMGGHTFIGLAMFAIPCIICIKNQNK